MIHFCLRSKEMQARISNLVFTQLNEKEVIKLAPLQSMRQFAKSRRKLVLLFTNVPSRGKNQGQRRRSQWPKKLVFAEVVAILACPGGSLRLGDRQSSWIATQLRYAGFCGVLVWSSASPRRVFLTDPKIQFLCSSSPILLGHRLHQASGTHCLSSFYSWDAYNSTIKVRIVSKQQKLHIGDLLFLLLKFSILRTCRITWDLSQPADQ